MDVVKPQNHSQKRSIQILAPRLANQIAAGEVVERPASVVKELVENALDAGATKLEIEIERGGHKLIRVRDNGCGIVKDQLELALSRHATSKISTLDDLEAINSLGFRGEALASVSSVSRLTLTSRTAGQTEAWQCYAEGRDMSVVLRPAAHPVGTSVEVSDLFFNTPARRKFLRTEKTEFTHIDELLKRIALSRFSVSLILKHNGKIVRQYRPALDQAGKERRLISIFNRQFVESSVFLESEHNGLKLSGWLCLPEGARAQSDWQYCYVNGRMMRDKLINHAIRQAFADSITSPLFPAYLLYITLPASEVDVNVHPAKHEVRFHQARLVHDYIVQVLEQALREGRNNALDGLSEYSAESRDTTRNTDDHDISSHRVDTAPPVVTEGHNYRYSQPDLSRSANEFSSASHNAGGVVNNAPRDYGVAPSNRQQLASYQAFLSASAAMPLVDPAANEGNKSASVAHKSGTPWGQVLTLQAGHVLLIEKEGLLYWLSLRHLWQELSARQLYQQWQQQTVISAPLLLPVRFAANDLFDLSLWQQGLNRLGFHFNQSPNGDLIITQLPSQLRSAVVAELFERMASIFADWQAQDATALEQGAMSKPQLLPLLLALNQTVAQKQDFELVQAMQLLESAQQETELQLFFNQSSKSSPCSFIYPLNTAGVFEHFRS